MIFEEPYRHETKCLINNISIHGALIQVIPVLDFF